MVQNLEDGHSIIPSRKRGRRQFGNPIGNPRPFSERKRRP